MRDTSRTHPSGLTYRVTPEMSLHTLFADGARQDASILHAVFRKDNDEQWYQLRVNGWEQERTPYEGHLPRMVAEVLGSTPRELAAPDEAFLHALGSTALGNDEVLLLLEVLTDGHTTRWRALYVPSRNIGGEPAAALVATLVDEATGM